MRVHPLAIALVAAVAAPWCARGRDRIEVVVFNFAGVPNPVISSAIDTARHAFRAAGIDSDWVVCEPDACPEEVPAGPYLEVFVMPRLLGKLPEHPDDHPAGFVIPGAFTHPRGYALYDAARMAADRTLRPMYEVLGCIFAHETGHLLGLGHQPHGIMRANLDGEDMDNATRGLAFSAAEGRKLREAVEK